jgi:hypothetical protein
MQIRMLKTENGSVDGIRVAQYIEGEEYDLTATDGERDLARAFVDAGFAEQVGGEAGDSDSGTETERKKPGRKPKAA